MLKTAYQIGVEKAMLENIELLKEAADAGIDLEKLGFGAALLGGLRSVGQGAMGLGRAGVDAARGLATSGMGGARAGAGEAWAALTPAAQQAAKGLGIGTGTAGALGTGVALGAGGDAPQPQPQPMPWQERMRMAAGNASGLAGNLAGRFGQSMGWGAPQQPQQ